MTFIGSSDESLDFDFSSTMITVHTACNPRPPILRFYSTLPGFVPKIKSSLYCDPRHHCFRVRMVFGFQFGKSG
jgi:hypothetical protein